MIGGNWTENHGSFGLQAEAPASSGNNDTTPGMSSPYPVIGVANINTVTDPLYVTGTGYVANGSDQDVYQFAVNQSAVSPCNTYLKITLTSPPGSSYQLDLFAWRDYGPGYQWSSTGGSGGNSGIQESYYDLSSLTLTAQHFYIVIRGNGSSSSSNPYSVHMAMVPSAFVSGQLSAASSAATGLANISVSAVDLSGRSFGYSTLR